MILETLVVAIEITWLNSTLWRCTGKIVKAGRNVKTGMTVKNSMEKVAGINPDEG